jgi:tellurite resistance protein
MELDERTAMAVAALSRFDAKASDEVLRAVAGAFAVVACADGELAESEVESFVRFVHESPAVARLGSVALERLFRDLCDAILVDFTTGRIRALEAIAAVKDDADHRALVMHAAEVAIMADDKLRKAEQVALMAIAKSAGVDVDSFAV